MEVKKYYDKFVHNFLVGSEEPLKNTNYRSERPLQTDDSIEKTGTVFSSDSFLENKAPRFSVEQTEVDVMQTENDVIKTEDRTDSFLVQPVSADEKGDGSPGCGSGESGLRDRVISALREVHDPEIPLNIYDLGLIYRIDITPGDKTSIDMTLTSPNCPVAGSLPKEVEDAVRSVEGIGEVVVEVVWDPPWDMERMDEAAKLELGLL